MPKRVWNNYCPKCPKNVKANLSPIRKHIQIHIQMVRKKLLWSIVSGTTQTIVFFQFSRACGAYSAKTTHVLCDFYLFQKNMNTLFGFMQKSTSSIFSLLLFCVELFITTFDRKLASPKVSKPVHFENINNKKNINDMQSCFHNVFW